MLPPIPIIELIPIILPHFCFIIDFIANWDNLKAAVRFIFITSSHCTFVILILKASLLIPALLIKISTELNFLIDFSHRFSISVSFERSAIIARLFGFNFFFNSSIFFLFVPVIITLAPNDDSFFAIDPPIDPEAPVINAVLFFKFKLVINYYFRLSISSGFCIEKHSIFLVILLTNPDKILPGPIS